MRITMRTLWRLVMPLAALALLIGSAVAEGNLASRPTNLELIMNPDLSMSAHEYELETGQYYRWTIISNGGDEFLVRAPALWRNVWINQIKVGELEVKPFGLFGMEFDDEGEMSITFVPIRPGNYDFWVEGHRVRGMEGTFIVR